MGETRKHFPLSQYRNLNISKYREGRNTFYRHGESLFFIGYILPVYIYSTYHLRKIRIRNLYSIKSIFGLRNKN